MMRFIPGFVTIELSAISFESEIDVGLRVDSACYTDSHTQYLV